MSFTIPNDYLKTGIENSERFSSEYVGSSIKITFARFWSISSLDAKNLFQANADINYIKCYWPSPTTGADCVCSFFRNDFNLN